LSSFPAIAGLAERHEALRQAAALPGADPGALLEAAFAELDGALELLTSWGPEESDASAEQAAPETLTAERRLLRAVFQHAPVPLLVLEQDGTVRRANGAAGELIGSPAGYATGRPLTAFVDLPYRAAVQSHLAAVARTGTARRVACSIIGPSGPTPATLTAGRFDLPDGQQLLIITAAPAANGAQAPGTRAPGTPKAGTLVTGAPENHANNSNHASNNDAANDHALRAMTKRMDMVTAVTRLLLDNSTFSEAVTLQRCARLLAGEMATWVIVDVERGGRLRRQFVIGPPGEAADDLSRQMRRSDPEPDTLTARVHAAGKPALLATVDDTAVLGAGPGGTPLAMLLGATSVLSVPIPDGGTSYGALTLVRLAADPRFEVADLALLEEIGQHLAVAIRVDRMFRHRSAVAEALQASLLPTTLPDIPGLDLSAAYLPAGAGLEVSGDFYDVFPVQDGWGITIGDVCGKGQEAAAMTAAARHAIRVLAAFTPDPAEVLVKANEVMLSGGYEDRFVTAKLAYLNWDEDGLRVRMGSSGHPGPALVHPDGRVDMLDGGGMPLGLFPAGEFPDSAPETETFRLHPGDLLFFFSDGVTDARNAELGYFEERLADELAGLAGRSATETARAVQNLLVSFSAEELRDDLTILVARVTDPPENHSS
jgi:serine phosphatase RsbU (regulator of sigma subunit)/PAS domain-containing protein